MPLITHVQNRYSVQLLRELTNPDEPADTAVDTAGRLQQAANDVEADFRVYAGITYDDADARHIAVAVVGVVQKLRVYMGQISDAMDAERKWRDMLVDLSKVTSRNRIMPVAATNITDEDADAEPAFRDSNFDNYRVGEPRGRSDLGTSDT